MLTFPLKADYLFFSCVTFVLYAGAVVVVIVLVFVVAAVNSSLQGAVMIVWRIRVETENCSVLYFVLKCA